MSYARFFVAARIQAARPAVHYRDSWPRRVTDKQAIALKMHRECDLQRPCGFSMAVKQDQSDAVQTILECRPNQ